MFRKWFAKDPRQLLPWYVNGSLSAREQRVVERWLAEETAAAEELAAWQRLRTAVHDQPQREPPAAVRRRVMAPAASRRRAQRAPRRRTWVWGAALSLVVLVLLWAVVRPGIVLQWEVNAGPVTEFRIYRAPVGSADFELVREVAARPGERAYTYVDGGLLPLRTYVYQVEAVDPGGGLVSSPLITASAVEALPAQLAVILTSLSVGWALILLAQIVPSGFFTKPRMIARG
jgi:hypothetical protein